MSSISFFSRRQVLVVASFDSLSMSRATGALKKHSPPCAARSTRQSLPGTEGEAQRLRRRPSLKLGFVVGGVGVVLFFFCLRRDTGEDFKEAFAFTEKEETSSCSFDTEKESGKKVRAWHNRRRRERKWFFFSRAFSLSTTETKKTNEHHSSFSNVDKKEKNRA